MKYGLEIPLNRPYKPIGSAILSQFTITWRNYKKTQYIGNKNKSHVSGLKVLCNRVHNPYQVRPLLAYCYHKSHWPCYQGSPISNLVWIVNLILDQMVQITSHIAIASALCVGDC